MSEVLFWECSDCAMVRNAESLNVEIVEGNEKVGFGELNIKKFGGGGCKVFGLMAPRIPAIKLQVLEMSSVIVGCN